MTDKPADELQALGSDNSPEARQTGQQQQKGLTDDRRLDLENVVRTVASLPNGAARQGLTGPIIAEL